MGTLVGTRGRGASPLVRGIPFPVWCQICSATIRSHTGGLAGQAMGRHKPRWWYLGPRVRENALWGVAAGVEEAIPRHAVSLSWGPYLVTSALREMPDQKSTISQALANQNPVC